MENWWSKRDKDKDIDPRLKDKSPADVAKMLDDAEAARKKAADLEAERVAERGVVDNLNTQFTSIKAKLDDIEKNGKPAPKVEIEDPENFIDNPDAAFNQRAKPLAQLTAQTAAVTAKMLAQQELDNRDMMSNGQTHDGRLFRGWSSEIQNYANQKQILELTQPQTWIDLYLKVKGLHADELADPEKKKKNYAFLESATSQAAPPPEDKSKLPADRQLTPEELRVAERMGVTPEHYLSRKQAMKVVA